MSATTRWRSVAAVLATATALVAIPATASAAPLTTIPFGATSPFNLLVPPNPAHREQRGEPRRIRRPLLRGVHPGGLRLQPERPGVHHPAHVRLGPQRAGRQEGARQPGRAPGRRGRRSHGDRGAAGEPGDQPLPGGPGAERQHLERVLGRHGPPRRQRRQPPGLRRRPRVGHQPARRAHHARRRAPRHRRGAQRRPRPRARHAAPHDQQPHLRAPGHQRRRQLVERPLHGPAGLPGPGGQRGLPALRGQERPRSASASSSPARCSATARSWSPTRRATASRC